MKLKKSTEIPRHPITGNQHLVNKLKKVLDNLQPNTYYIYSNEKILVEIVELNTFNFEYAVH